MKRSDFQKKNTTPFGHSKNHTIFDIYLIFRYLQCLYVRRTYKYVGAKEDLMEYKLNITFEINDASREKQACFYNKLKDLKWTNKENSQVWSCGFKESVSRYHASKLIRMDLKKAKASAGIKEVLYKIQMEHINIMAGVI